MKKYIFILSMLILWTAGAISLASTVHAQDATTILPKVEGDTCPDIRELRNPEQSRAGQHLGCKIKTGTIRLDDIPFVIRELSEFLIALGGIICMFFIVVGGYYYIFGGLTDDKEKGKKTILYACIGLVIVSLSWIIVNVVIYVVTQ